MDASPRRILTGLAWPRILAIAGLYVLAVVLVHALLPAVESSACAKEFGHAVLRTEIGFDYICVFRPAVDRLFHAQTPYAGPYYNPPWVLLLLAPLSLLPPAWAAAALLVIALAAFGVAAARIGMSRLAIAVFLINPFLFVVARQGNIDWLVALGAVLPPQIGIFLIAAKPQAGLAIGLFWLVEALRQGGIRQALKVFAPVGAITLLSFVIFGLWIIPPVWVVTNALNYSLWPASIPIGLALLAAAIRARDVRRAITASPFLSPYVLTMTWSIAFLGLHEWELVAATIGAYAIFYIAPAFGMYPLRLMP